MNIQAINSVNTTFGKIGKSGKKFGRNHIYTIRPEVKGQTAKIETWYENQVNLLCSSITDKKNLDEELRNLYIDYVKKLDSLAKRK